MHDKSARDGRMKIGGGRGEEKFKDVRRFMKVLEGQRRESTGYEGQKEGGGPTTPRHSRGCGRQARRMGGGVFCLSDIKEPVANFLPSSIPVSSLSRSHPSRRVPFSLPVIPSGGHTRSCSIHPHIHVHTMRSRLEFQSSGR